MQLGVCKLPTAFLALISPILIGLEGRIIRNSEIYVILVLKELIMNSSKQALN